MPLAEAGRAEPGPIAPASDAPGRRRSLAKLAALAALLVGGFLAARLTPLGEHLSREGIGQAVEWLRGNPWAPAVFVGTYAAFTALALPGTVLTLAGGAVFGFGWGVAYNTIAANLGASAAFLIARNLGRDGVRRLAGDDSKTLARLDAVVARHGFRGLLTLRLIPLVPFNALNFGSGLTNLKWSAYAAATAIGIVPGTVVYTFFADALLQGSQEASRGALVRLLAAGALLAALSFLPALLKRLRVRLPGLGAVAVLALGAASGVLPIASAGAQATVRAALPDHSAFTRVLADVVVGSEPGANRAGASDRPMGPGVDYARLAADPSALYAYLATLEATPPELLEAAPRNDRLAFWINAYNACMLNRVVEHYPIQPAGGLLGLKNRAAGRPANSVWQIDDVFEGRHCPVAGAPRSQDEIEHEIVRPLGDPRIHFAVNCAARSCPPLAPRAYEGDRLGEQLDAQVAAFLQDPAHFRVSRQAGRTVVTVNRVLDWFGEDFGGPEGVLSFLAGYAQGSDSKALDDPAARLEFFEYDWTLNDRAR